MFVLNLCLHENILTARTLLFEFTEMRFYQYRFKYNICNLNNQPESKLAKG